MRLKKRHNALYLICFINFGLVQAQNLNYPLHFELHNKHDATMLKSDHSIHSGLRPLNQQFAFKTIEPAYEDSTLVYSEFHMKFLKKHLVEIKGKDFQLYFDILFGFEVGGDLLDTFGRGTLRDNGGTFYVNTRGAQAMGNLGKKVSFYTSFHENQAFFPDYIRLSNLENGEYFWDGSKYRQQFGLVPGQGRAKEFKSTGFDYAYASGYISYAIHPNVNLQYGHGKHFIGHGYRSMLLSDNSFNYPYWSARSQFLNGKLSYNFIYAYMQNLYRLPEHSAPEASFIRKNGTFSYLSYIPFKRLEIALFEGSIWKVYDTLSGSEPASPISYIPIGGISSISNGLNNAENNVVLGLNLKYQITDSIMLYGQIMLDDLKHKKYGYQLGIKTFDVLLPGLTLTSEINYAQDYSYTHNNLWQAYTHYNQALAHPYGAGFFEWVSFAQYQLPKRFWASYKFNLANRIIENDNNNGSDLFVSYIDDDVTNDKAYSLQFHQARIGYKANIKTNINIYTGVNYRNIAGVKDGDTFHWYIGISTDLTNKYFDF